MRVGGVIVLSLLVCIIPGVSMAGMFDVQERDLDLSQQTLFRVKIEKFEPINGGRQAHLRVLQVHGNPEIIVFSPLFAKSASDPLRGKSTIIKVGQILLGNALVEGTWDDEGPLSLLRIKGELEKSSLKINEEYFFVYPDKYLAVTKDLLKKFKEKKKSI